VGRAFVLAGASLLMSLALAPVADAEVTQSTAASRSQGAPLPPAYVLERDGTVIHDGDLITDCRSLVAGLERGYEGTGPDKVQARTVADRCRDLGVPSDSETGNSDVILSLGTTESPAPSGGELPDTSGLSLSALAGLASGITLIVGGLLLRRRRV